MEKLLLLNLSLNNTLRSESSETLVEFFLNFWLPQWEKEQ
jgi:hypothetical protein